MTAATMDRARSSITADVEAARREVDGLEERMRQTEGLGADPLDDAVRGLGRTLDGVRRQLHRARDFTGVTVRRAARDPYRSAGFAFAAGAVAVALVVWVSRRSAALAAAASAVTEVRDEVEVDVAVARRD